MAAKLLQPLRLCQASVAASLSLPSPPKVPLRARPLAVCQPLAEFGGCLPASKGLVHACAGGQGVAIVERLVLIRCGIDQILTPLPGSATVDLPAAATPLPPPVPESQG